MIFPQSFIAVKPGLLVGVDGEAHSPSSALPAAEFLFALIPHSLLCLFVQIKRSVNNPGSYLFMAVLFGINWAGAAQGVRLPRFPPLLPCWLLLYFQWDGSAGASQGTGLQCWEKPGNGMAVLGDHFHGYLSARSC